MGLIHKSQLAWVKTIKNHITFQMLYIKLRKCIILKVVGYETQIAWITFIRNGKFYLRIVWPILRCGTWGESVQLKQMFPSCTEQRVQCGKIRPTQPQSIFVSLYQSAGIVKRVSLNLIVDECSRLNEQERRVFSRQSGIFPFTPK